MKLSYHSPDISSLNLSEVNPTDHFTMYNQKQAIADKKFRQIRTIPLA